MASGGPAPLARMYREQLCRRARSVGTVGLLPELNGLSFETEEYFSQDMWNWKHSAVRLYTALHIDRTSLTLTSESVHCGSRNAQAACIYPPRTLA